MAGKLLIICDNCVGLMASRAHAAAAMRWSHANGATRARSQRSGRHVEREEGHN